jgi:two-component system chemotaxis response regulator CheY
MSDKMKILIVDDSTIICQAIESHLSDYPVDIVGSAENGKRALEMFNEFRPDIVTLDITMPELDGLSVLESIIELDPDVKVMIVTALSDKDTALKAIELGAKSYVTKPFTPDKLKEAFEKLIA